MSEVTNFLLEEIDGTKGDMYFYSKVVEDNIEFYRTLDAYISSKIDKQELADRLGLTSTRALESWEVKGMKYHRALECAIAMKLNLEKANEFLTKYAGMRSLYPASKEDFRAIYVLIYREKLEKQFPYREKESVKEWMERIFPLLEFTEKANELSKVNEELSKDTTKSATKTYLEALLEQNLELIPSLKFRSAGERALEYLDELVRDTPFEKNYGNRSNKNEDNEVKNERNGSIHIDLYGEEEKDHYRLIRNKLKTGEIPHRDDLIQFAMGSTVSFGRKEIDQFLTKSGYEPLMSRDLYEGMLLTVYMYDEYVDLEGNTSNDIDKIILNLKRAARKATYNGETVSKDTPEVASEDEIADFPEEEIVFAEETVAYNEETVSKDTPKVTSEGKIADFPEEEIMFAVETVAYKEDARDYVDFQVFVSEKVDEAIEYLPEVSYLLREVPKWYLDKQKRLKRMEKRYFSDIIMKISEKMTKTWKLINKNQLKAESVSEATLRKAAANDILMLKRGYLDKETYKKVLDIICRTEVAWLQIVKSGILTGMKRDDYLLVFNETLEELDSYYRDTYALKKKHSDKKGQSGGKPKK